MTWGDADELVARARHHAAELNETLDKLEALGIECMTVAGHQERDMAGYCGGRRVNLGLLFQAHKADQQPGKASSFLPM